MTVTAFQWPHRIPRHATVPSSRCDITRPPSWHPVGRRRRRRRRKCRCRLYRHRRIQTGNTMKQLSTSLLNAAVPQPHITKARTVHLSSHKTLDLLCVTTWIQKTTQLYYTSWLNVRHFYEKLISAFQAVSKKTRKWYETNKEYTQWTIKTCGMTNYPIGPHRTQSDPIGPNRTPSDPIGTQSDPNLYRFTGSHYI